MAQSCYYIDTPQDADTVDGGSIDKKIHTLKKERGIFYDY